MFFTLYSSFFNVNYPPFIIFQCFLPSFHHYSMFFFTPFSPVSNAFYTLFIIFSTFPNLFHNFSMFLPPFHHYSMFFTLFSSLFNVFYSFFITIFIVFTLFSLVFNVFYPLFIIFPCFWGGGGTLLSQHGLTLSVHVLEQGANCECTENYSLLFMSLWNKIYIHIILQIFLLFSIINY